MSAALTTVMAIGLAGSTAAQMYGQHQAGRANERQNRAAADANRESLAYQKEQDALDREERARTDAYNQAQYEQARREEQRRYDLERQLDDQRYAASQAFNREQFDFERQRYGDRQNQMAPYRTRGAEALNRLAAVNNITIRPTTAPGQPAPTMADLARG